MSLRFNWMKTPFNLLRPHGGRELSPFRKHADIPIVKSGGFALQSGLILKLELTHAGQKAVWKP